MTTTSLPAPVKSRTNGMSNIPDVPIRRFRVAEYHAMIRNGILGENDPVELLEGWLVIKMSKNRPHCTAIGLLQDALPAILPAQWFIESQEPVGTEESEPEPDLSIIRGHRRDYPRFHPTAAAAALVIEVADSSLSQDRGIKKRIYARAGFAAYRIVNLVDEIVEVYTLPRAWFKTGFHSSNTNPKRKRGELLASLTLRVGIIDSASPKLATRNPRPSSHALPSGPTDDPDYATRRDYGPSDSIPLLLDGVEAGRIEVKEILP